MFKEDFMFEQRVYEKIVMPVLKKFNPKWMNDKESQKNDIDFIIDNDIKYSLKAIRKKFRTIFFETIKNCNTQAPGWAYYSKADFVLYIMNANPNIPNVCKVIQFRISDVKNNLVGRDINSYRKGFGINETYKTEGRLVPLEDFEHDIHWDGT